MVLLCEIWRGRGQSDGIRVLECRGLDSLAVIPEEIEGLAVTGAAPYLFSDYESQEKEMPGEAFWWSDSGERVSEETAACLPLLKGGRLEELRLPSSLQKVGAYAFYNCESLKKLEVFSTTPDWGAGVFTGCGGIRELVLHVDEGQKSCMKELLAELRQTLSITYLGAGKAKLVFSEFFEEAVENTPARILVTNTHGCGKQYRNAFVNTQFQFREYDSLFPYVKVQEPEKLAAQVALGRILYPYQLASCHRGIYEDYLKEHNVAAACQAVERQSMEELTWLMEHVAYDAWQMGQVIEDAMARGDYAIVSYLMDQRKGKRVPGRRRFGL